MTVDLKTSQILQALPLFHGMEDDLLHGLIASARFIEHDKGSVFLEQDQPITRFYIILDGWCGATKTNVGGQESILQIFRHGDFLPEPGNAASMTISQLNLRALSPVRLAMLAPNIVRNALEHSKPFSANMLAASIQRNNELRDHIEQLTLHTAEERVGRFLLDMRLEAHATSDIPLPFDKSLIAGYLGIKPETFSRTLQSFKENGFAVQRNNLHIPDVHALCSYCDSVAAQKCRHSETDDCPQHGGDMVRVS